MEFALALAAPWYAFMLLRFPGAFADDFLFTSKWFSNGTSGVPLARPASLASGRAFYVFGMGVFAVSALLITNLRNGKTGLAPCRLHVVLPLNGLQSDLRDKILVANPHLRVLTYGSGLRLDNWRDVIQEVRREPGVIAASPLRPLTLPPFRPRATAARPTPGPRSLMSRGSSRYPTGWKRAAGTPSTPRAGSCSTRRTEP